MKGFYAVLCGTLGVLGCGPSQPTTQTQPGSERTIVVEREAVAESPSGSDVEVRIDRDTRAGDNVQRRVDVDIREGRINIGVDANGQD